MNHCHSWNTVVEGAIAEFPKQNAKEPIRVTGWAYGCECGRWEFETDAVGFNRVEVIPPSEMTFKPKE